jgi:hypothetical protein
MDEMETVIATYSFLFYIDPHIPFLYQSIMLKIAMHKVKKHQLNYNMEQMEACKLLGNLPEL